MRSPLLAALLAAAAVIAGCGVDDPYQGNQQTTPTTETTTATTATVTTPAPVTTTPGNDAQESDPALSPAQREAQDGAERAARAFLRTFLPYSYGQRRASTIRAATPTLRRELARQPPRVAPELVANGRPRVVSLRASSTTRSRVYYLAQIDDGQSDIYGAALTVERRGDRWLVSQVQ